MSPLMMTDPHVREFMEDVARQMRKIIELLDKLDKRIATLEEAERKSVDDLVRRLKQ